MWQMRLAERDQNIIYKLKVNKANFKQADNPFSISFFILNKL